MNSFSKKINKKLITFYKNIFCKTNTSLVSFIKKMNFIETNTSLVSIIEKIILVNLS